MLKLKNIILAQYIEIYRGPGKKLNAPAAELFISFCGGDTWGDVSSQKARFFKNAIQKFNEIWQ